MTKSRLEAFTDGVVAIVLTVLILDIKIPDPSGIHSLWTSEADYELMQSVLYLLR